VPAYNASATIGRALEALSKQNCFQPYEVIVVDDGSVDNTADIVTRVWIPAFAGMTKKLTYVRQDNAGPAAARNHGARLASGEFLAFTDSDCIPHEDWISRLMAGFAQEHIGVVAGSYGIANPESRLARCICKEILWRHTHLMPDFPNSFGSYNFCAKKNVFDAVGGFNTAYRTASGEDNDLSYKIIASGWRIYFERKALVDHYHPTQIIKYLKEQFRHGFWRVRMYKDHPRMMRGDGYTFWKDIVEVPWAACCLAGLALSVFQLVKDCFVASLLAMTPVLAFILFEVVWALVMMCCFFDGIFFSFIFLFRAVSRLFGFSTGILSLLFKKEEK